MSAVTMLALASCVAALTSVVWTDGWIVAAACALVAAALDIGRRVVTPAGGRLSDSDIVTLGELSRTARAIFPGTGSDAAFATEAGAVGAAAVSATTALRALAVVRENLQQVLHSVADPLLVTDPQGSVRIWNRAAEDFLSRPGDRIAGRSIDELFTSADLFALHRSALGGATTRSTVKLPRSTGIRWYEVVASPVEWKSADGVEAGEDRSAAVLALRDITELAAAGQLQSDFVANASHELRTPLASIRGAAETLLDDSEDPQLREKLLRMIASNVGRLEELIRDLLDLSRLDAAEIGPAAEDMSISSVVSSLRAGLAPLAAERKLDLRFEMDDSLEAMHADPRLLDLILRNLIENSLKFAYEQTAVVVRGEAVPADSGSTTFLDARFRVIDQGQGIPLAAQPRIFERFYQVDSSRGGGTHRRGTGLGLAIVKSAVDALKGTIRVESVWKQGTTMTVELPACVRGASFEQKTGHAA